MSTWVERKLGMANYSSEKCNWNFKKYVKLHKDQHAILERLIEHGYAGIDARSKVRHLLKGIKTTAFDTVKTRIITDATLHTNFDACVNLFQDFIEQHRAMHTTGHQGDAQLVSFKGEAEVSVGINKLTHIEDCYYKKEEYDALTPDEKKALHEKHGKHGHKRGAKDSTRLSNLKPKAKASAKMMLSKHSISCHCHCCLWNITLVMIALAATPLMRNLT